MVCPFCLHKKTAVYNSRPGTKLNATWRRRRCTACEREFTTYETADAGAILQIKEGSRILPYSHLRLAHSLLIASDHRDDIYESAAYLTGIVEQQLYKKCAVLGRHWISKDEITATVLDILKRFDSAAYIKYLSKHQVNLDATAIRRALRRTK